MGLGVVILTGFLVFLGLGILAGFMYHAVGTAADLRKYPPPGRLVGVNGHRLHYQLCGDGLPTVVMDSGFLSSSLNFVSLQAEVSKYTSVFSYDRAGLGWSDPGPMPRTSRQIVEELHTLLQNSRVRGPFLLVGHSFGAFNVRLFASLYPEEVAGLVLLDPIHPEDWLNMAPEYRKELAKAVRLCRYGAVLARFGIARAVSALVKLGANGAARASVNVLTGGMGSLAARVVDPASKLPPEALPIVRMFWTQPKFYSAMASQAESLYVSAAQVAAGKHHGEIPVFVLSASKPVPDRVALQEELARRSVNGRHIIIENSGHWVHLDQPGVVIETIEEAVNLIRAGASDPVGTAHE